MHVIRLNAPQRSAGGGGGGEENNNNKRHLMGLQQQEPGVHLLHLHRDVSPHRGVRRETTGGRCSGRETTRVVASLGGVRQEQVETAVVEIGTGQLLAVGGLQGNEAPIVKLFNPLDS